VEHLGSAHTDAELALLLAAARERRSPGQDALELGDVSAVPVGMDDVADWTSDRRRSGGQPVLGGPVSEVSAGGRRSAVNAGGRAGGRVVATSSVVMWQVLTTAYSPVGFDVLADDAFRAMVLARIVEPTSKADSLRVLAELGAPCP
jgi:hypothetical protein